MRTLDKSKPYLQVFGDVDESEKDKAGKPHTPHRYRQFGMMFDEAENLIGEELEVPPDEETKEQLTDRLTREIRAQVEREHREKLAEMAKNGGVSKDVAKKDAGDPDLPGSLGQGDTSGRQRKSA